MHNTEEDLQNEETWDLDAAERREPVANRRAVVSVAFASKDLAVVSAAARESGMKVSEFIREAAVERANGARWLLAISRTFSLSTSARLNGIQVTETMVSSQRPDTILMHA